MSMIQHIYKTVDEFFAWISTSLKQDVFSYCDLETADDETTLVSKSGELVSVFQIDGFRSIIGDEEFTHISKRLFDLFQSIFNKKGHSLQITFSSDPLENSSDIDKLISSAQGAAKQAGMALDDLYVSKGKKLQNYVSQERCYLIIWTTNKVFPGSVDKKITKKHGKKFKKINLPYANNAQQVFLVTPELRSVHRALVSHMLESIKSIGFDITLLSAHAASHCIRKNISPTKTSSDWQAHLPGDCLSFNEIEDFSDISAFLWPKLCEQVIPGEARNINNQVVEIDDYIYAPMVIELFPKSIQIFYTLFRQLKEANIPWRIAYSIKPQGMSVTQSKAFLAQFLTFASAHNKRLVNAHQLLRHYHDNSDDPVIRFSISLVSWAPKGNMEQLVQNAAQLMQIVQSWGGAEVTGFTGDPTAAFFSTVPAAMENPIAPYTAAPLSDAIEMLPLVRPASPWESGAAIFRTNDGKLWPYQPGSSLQISWIDLVFARSGSGKSVLLNTLNLALCLSRGISDLPFISIIDIGPSSQGFISLVQESLPVSRQDQVMYHRFQMSENDKVNPFDTPLGCKHALLSHKSFLINFICLLLTEKVHASLPEGMSSMVSLIVDQVYLFCADEKTAKPYVEGVNLKIDAALRPLISQTLRPQSWWEVGEILFVEGHIELSRLAQNYATPELSDTVTVANFRVVEDLYRDSKLQSGEDFISYYCRSISSIIRQYPSLIGESRLNIGDARIIAMDIEGVASAGSDIANKQTAIAYMLARHVTSAHFFHKADDFKNVNPVFKNYHLARLEKDGTQIKKIVYDEFHRTAECQSTRQQVVTDMREGRKQNVQISLASQSLSDFDKLMIEFATSIFIMDSGSKISIDQISETFGLSAIERYVLQYRVHGPSAHGASFLARFITQKGTYTQLLNCTLSAIELWAFSTTKEDVIVREKLYQLLGAVKARSVLAERFPQGSVKDYIAFRLKQDDTLNVKQVLDEIVYELAALE
ncbi:AAA family ATPase [Facilibium subflavum]|uniref:AAA family ATPase n=1 Tax=Facilibium subflavum TaxID=2219058 RepID=UPI000E646501|nr:AAA family ATPase [Facilibium subflavum]